ncbi:cytochrome P450 [Nocardia transvalensis]|uniref:cytochrome P450 n=1 Tax=Nocardia transvalensis TaxID=37333 RepID=UPI00189415CE|nr:cytochrome P450 [Nocardia transvalensis]MBF6329300.1 cytochrome P450 [Nocardia transvalensis]
MSVSVDIYDPDLYVGGPIHDIFAELRRSDPVHWQDMPGEPGYWAVLTHADVVHVARNPRLYSAERAGVLLEDPPPQRLAQSRNMLLMMDPPRHTGYRKPVAEHFKARVIGRLAGRVRELTRRLLSDVDGTVEFVHDVAGVLPSQVVGGLFGIPEPDWPLIRRWAEQSTSSQDPELIGDSAFRQEARRNDEGEAELSMMVRYGVDFAIGRRADERPREDLTSLILSGSFGGRPMSEPEFGAFFTQLVTAGNDTTKAMLSSGLQLLLDHPDQMRQLRAEPGLIPAAVEEILRYANPLHYFRRTATEDTELHGVPIRAGDKVAMWYTSANRDETVFDDPQRFDIRRNPNPHLSFGTAHHFCLGVHLARLEGRVFFEELLTAFPGIEAAGPARRIRSNLVNGWKTLPIRLSR